MYVSGRFPDLPPGPGRSAREEPEQGPVGAGRGQSGLVGVGRARNSEQAGKLGIFDGAGI